MFNMITGKKKKTAFSFNDVLELTNNGRDIYVKYLGKISNKAMKRPWGKDSHPSWGVWQSAEGRWLWKDLATEESGGAIQFVQRMFNLSYSEAIDKIYYDLALGEKDVSVKRQYDDGTAMKVEYIHIAAKVMKFKERHHAFWNAVGVTEDWCKKFDCYAVKELAINRVKYPIGEYECVFVYFASDINKVKVYFPNREGAGRFRTNVYFEYLWEYHKQTHSDKLVVHKSMKDLITFAQLHPHNIATQNESIKVFSPDVVDKINEMSDEPWVFYGSDVDGVKKCIEITKNTGWKYINTPHNMLPEVNDIYSFVKKHGINKLEQFCKLKKLI